MSRYRLLACSACLLLSACTFTNEDLFRPLAAENVPKLKAAEAYLAVFPQLDPSSAEDMAAVEATLNKSRTAKTLFGIRKWGDKGTIRDTVKLFEALDAHHQNPFAWHQLAATLALQYRFDLALVAARRELEILDLLATRDAEKAEAAFADLRARGIVNAALYSLALGDNHTALDRLQTLEQVDVIDAFPRLAFYWMATLAFSGIGETENALATLEIAKRVAEDPSERLVCGAPRQALALDDLPDPGGGRGAPARALLPSDTRLRFDYPQYFKSKRRWSVHLFLEGLVALESGDYEAAKDLLDRSITCDKENWDAQFARARSDLLAGDAETAASRIELLIDAVPSRMLFRDEQLRFSAGILAGIQQRPRHAEERFLQALCRVERRNRHFFSEYQEISDSAEPGSIEHEILQQLTRESFPEANNNLANLYAEQSRRNGLDSGFSRLADIHYCFARKSTAIEDDERPTVNWFHWLWHTGRHDTALMLLDELRSAGRHRVAQALATEASEASGAEISSTMRERLLSYLSQDSVPPEGEGSPGPGFTVRQENLLSRSSSADAADLEECLALGGPELEGLDLADDDCIWRRVRKRILEADRADR